MWAWYQALFSTHVHLHYKSKVQKPDHCLSPPHHGQLTSQNSSLLSTTTPSCPHITWSQHMWLLKACQPHFTCSQWCLAIFTQLSGSDELSEKWSHCLDIWLHVILEACVTCQHLSWYLDILLTTGSKKSQPNKDHYLVWNENITIFMPFNFHNDYAIPTYRWKNY